MSTASFFETDLNFVQTCPFLIRVFTSTNGHHREEDFQDLAKKPNHLEKDEIHIHTW
jgi:hypothetical protein